MQHPFSCVPSVMQSIEQSLSIARLARYLPAAGGDRQLALRLYIWNSRLCEALYLPTQFGEVCSRNAISAALQCSYGSDWITNRTFVANLPRRLRDELTNAMTKERLASGSYATPNDVVSRLSFGFWVHLLTTGFDHLIWKSGVRQHFPHAPLRIQRQDIHGRLERLRNFRNRLAHHYPVFDRRPNAVHTEIIELIGWICMDTKWLAMELSTVSKVINQRPR